MQYCFFEKGDILFNQGDIISCFYILQDGLVSITENHVENILNSEGYVAQEVFKEEIHTINSGYSIGDIAILRD